MRKELEQTKLIISRLNSMWSFTGRVLSHKVDLYLRATPTDDMEALLYVVAAYGCLAAHAGLAIEDGLIPDDTWDRLFRNVGQAALFDMPESFKHFQRKAFDKASARAFRVGWQGDHLPLPR